MWNRSNNLKDLRELKKYERIYDWKDIVLYNSYCLLDNDKEEQQKGIMSNFYSPCNIQFKGKEFCSSEQLYFYRIISEWGKSFKESDAVLKELMTFTEGRQVKNCEAVRKIYKKIETKLKKELGVEAYCVKDWKLMYECIRLKYKYCKPFRDVLDKYKNKIVVEDSLWGDNWAGALWDKKIGKYRGCNVCGRAIMRVYKERDEIMRES